MFTPAIPKQHVTAGPRYQQAAERRQRSAAAPAPSPGDGCSAAAPGAVGHLTRAERFAVGKLRPRDLIARLSPRGWPGARPDTRPPGLGTRDSVPSPGSPRPAPRRSAMARNPPWPRPALGPAPPPPAPPLAPPLSAAAVAPPSGRRRPPPRRPSATHTVVPF